MLSHSSETLHRARLRAARLLRLLANRIDGRPPGSTIQLTTMGPDGRPATRTFVDAIELTDQ